MNLDSVDRSIVETLQAEGRVTWAELAQRVGLTAAPTQARAAKLESAGIIQGYTARLDRRRIGLGFTAFVSVLLKNHSAQEEGEFERAMADIPEVLEVHHVAGNEDYLLKVVASDVADFERVLRHEISNQPQVQRVKTTLVLSSPKETAECPVR